MGKLLDISIDFSDLLNTNDNMAEEITALASEAVEKLSAQAHAHLIELASTKLHSRRDYFLERLPPPEKLDSHAWLITIPESLMWIEEGIPSGFNMLPGLLKGAHSKVIPFKHNSGPSAQSAVQKAMAKTIKDEMKKKKIPWKAVEKNPDGSPKLGLLHKFDVHAPQQQNQVKPPFQGPQGQKFQTNPRPQGQEGGGSRDWTWNVRVYQRIIENSKGKQSTERNVMTFRTASDKQSGSLWIHQGLPGEDFLDQTAQWANDQVDAIITEIEKKLGLV